VALAAAALPARESTAALLLLLLVGDGIAVAHYQRDCDWRLLRHLVPGVVPGLVLGALVLAAISDDALRRGIGVVILVLVALQLVLRWRHTPSGGWSLLARGGTGVAAGFTTMVANAGGSVMALYLVGQGVEKRQFLGTAAWFFLGVNLCKLPFSVGLGLIDADMLRTTALLAPLVLLGAWAGVHAVRRMRQRTFDVLVLVTSAGSAAALVLG
jgi:uncharacterized membrane protein YfcA